MRILAPAAIAAAGQELVDEIVAAREMTIAAGSGALQGSPVAALLFADFAVLTEESSLDLASADAWAAAISRIGRRALRLHLIEGPSMSAGQAHAAGLADALVPAARDPLEWISEWIGNRSEQALDSAAMLIRSRAGDHLERAEFARLFAHGVPQAGLDAFLNKRSR
jgi:enoyl-CoA hydratase/carnithine racemase